MKNKGWLAFYAAHSGDKMSLQKTTSSYAWMTKANICLYTIKVKEAIWMIMRPKLELLKAIRKRG
jgi:hypothetical protein